MTCIVGIAREGRVYIGGDSCGSGGDQWSLVPNPKVFAIENAIIGGCGSFRMIDLLRFSLKLPSHDAAVSTDAFMRTDFIKALRKVLLDEGHLHRENMRESGGNFLIGYRGALFEVQSDFSVLDAPDFGISCGSGEIAARGSLHTTRSDPDCPGRILRALEAAESVTPSVRGPFVIRDL